MAERSKEHVDGAANCEYDNFIVKHWVTAHREVSDPPRMCFKVLKSFQDALSRLATESVYIDAFGSLNSKSEYRNNRISRIVVEDPRREYKEKRKGGDKEDEEERILKEIDHLKTEMEERKRLKKLSRGQTSSSNLCLVNNIEKRIKPSKILLSKRKEDVEMLENAVVNKKIKLSVPQGDERTEEEVPGSGLLKGRC